MKGETSCSGVSERSIRSCLRRSLTCAGVIIGMAVLLLGALVLLLHCSRDCPEPEWFTAAGDDPHAVAWAFCCCLTHGRAQAAHRLIGPAAADDLDAWFAVHPPLPDDCCHDEDNLGISLDLEPDRLIAKASLRYLCDDRYVSIDISGVELVRRDARWWVVDWPRRIEDWPEPLGR